MPIKIDGMTLFRIGEALLEAGISRPTYFRWVKAGRVPDTKYSDRNGRRLFTIDELELLKSTSMQLNERDVQKKTRALPFRRTS